MNSTEIFSLALGLTAPWFVSDLSFRNTANGNKELHLQISFHKGSKFPDSMDVLSSVHDTCERKWQHLNFFEHVCYIHCNVPRIKEECSGKVKQINVPWARQGSGFTLLFEAFSMALIEREMTVNSVGDLLKVYPKRIWRIFSYWIDIAYNKDVQDDVTVLGIDETSSKKGHDYITIAADMNKKRVLHATRGKGKSTIKNIRKHLESKGCIKEQIEHISIDMSPSFIAGTMDEFPQANIVFDKFHIIKLLNEAMDNVRKSERKEHHILKNHKYTFLKKESKLSDKQRSERDELIHLLPTIGEAYRLKELFNDLWSFTDKDEASAFLTFWCDMVDESKVIPFKKFVMMIKAHWTGILNYFKYNVTNGVLEGINSKVQLAKRRARGYRNTDNFISMIYFLMGKLKFDYPQYMT